jgi:hypothetical protein
MGAAFLRPSSRRHGGDRRLRRMAQLIDVDFISQKARNVPTSEICM